MKDHISNPKREFQETAKANPDLSPKQPVDPVSGLSASTQYQILRGVLKL